MITYLITAAAHTILFMFFCVVSIYSSKLMSPSSHIQKKSLTHSLPPMFCHRRRVLLVQDVILMVIVRTTDRNDSGVSLL
mmetsp:Transcript_29623/g.33955  ORF Transcript_29623/g.33955 Transcript_29623/m.33955 type:complete len:80 (-) Transcript_29623:62-301(-)